MSSCDAYPETRTRRPNAWSAFLCLGAVVLVTTACATTGALPEPEWGTLVVELEPVEGEILVDGTRYGRTSPGVEHVVRLRPGAYRLELAAPGHLSRRYDLEVLARSITEIRVELWAEVDELDGANETGVGPAR